MKASPRLFLVTAVIGSLITVSSQCTRYEKPENDPRGAEYAGSVSCAGCHKDIYNSYLETSHYQTSRPASRYTVKGSFAPLKNVFLLNDSMKVIMEEINGELYQTGYIHGKKTERHRFDITFGAGRSQTYLYWHGDTLFQLPVSYFAPASSWVNSPGYPTDHIYFNRLIVSRCFECHGSYIEKKPLQTQSLKIVDEFKKESLVYGIDCERCHGPAAEHVEFHTDNPSEKKAKHITAVKGLSRQQQLDMCAVCHSGDQQKLQKSTFSFQPGDLLSDFYFPDLSRPDISDFDVHGNQYQLLTSSQCFIQSNMDCSSCHNVHKKESGNLTLAASNCIKCHQDIKHTFTAGDPALKAAEIENCIDCHMPAKPSQLISFRQSESLEPLHYSVRTHRIAVYPEESAKIISWIRGQEIPE